jgi:hypothetical protein
METMVRHGVTYCGMQVITQFQVGDGAAELEADSDFATLFGDGERQAFRDFTRRLQGSWTQEDLEYGRAANEQRIEWMRRFRELGGVLIAGTDMQFGGIMLHRELRNLEALGMSRLEVITATTDARGHYTGRKSLELSARVRRSRRAPPRPIGDLGALRDIECVFKDGKAVWADGEFGDLSRNAAEHVPT